MFPQRTDRHRAAPLVAGLLMLSVWLQAGATDEEPDITVEQTIRRPETEVNGWAIALDNDLFGPANTDRDYSGGFGLSINGARTAKYWWSLDRLLTHIDAPLFAGKKSWQGVRPDHTHAGVAKGMGHQRRGGLGGVPLPPVVGVHAVGDLHDPIGSRRPLETTRPDNRVRAPIDDGKSECPEIHACRIELSKPAR